MVFGGWLFKQEFLSLWLEGEGFPQETPMRSFRLPRSVRLLHVEHTVLLLRLTTSLLQSEVHRTIEIHVSFFFFGAKYKSCI